MTDVGAQPSIAEVATFPAGTATLSELLLNFVRANPEQLVGNETAEEWVASFWKIRNPAAKLKKALNEFLAIFEPFGDPAADALREVIEPLTK